MFPVSVIRFPQFQVYRNITSLSPCHFLGVTLSQSEHWDPDLEQSDTHLDKNILIKVSSGLKYRGLHDQNSEEI